MEKEKVLVIEDEKKLRELLNNILSLEGYHLFSAENALTGLDILKKEEIRVVISDVKLPDLNGIDLLQRIKGKFPDIEVIILTAYSNVMDAVKAIKLGAFDYLRKGEDDDKLPVIVQRALEKVLLKKQIVHLQNRVESQSSFDKIIGKSGNILNAIELAKKVAGTGTTVLLMGETGTGKELFAEAIHQYGRRKNNPFIAINCASIPKELQESEFFGHKKGSFTGASYEKKGLFEEANSGTLFLDEVGEMDAGLQAKLLRVLETNTFTKIGDNDPISIDVRIIAATNRNLNDDVNNSIFRKDLFYRLNTFIIEIPSLKERIDDLEVLLYYFINNISEKFGKKVTSINKDFTDVLKLYNWPGNIRELKNVVERAIILCEDGILKKSLLPEEMTESLSVDQTILENESEFSLANQEKNHIKKVIQITNGNKTEAAKKLGIGLATLYRKIKEYNLE